MRCCLGSSKYASNKRKRKYTYYEGGCLSAILFHVWYPLSLMITLLIGPTNVFGARFYQIDLESYVQVNQLGMWVSLRQMVHFKDSKLFTFLFGGIKWLLKCFYNQTHFEIRAHKPWHYFILFGASVKKLRWYSY